MVFDKAYYSYKNYSLGISRFKIVPLIFPKKNFKMNKLICMISYLLSIFCRSNLEKNKKFFNHLMRSLKIKLENWDKYKPLSGNFFLGGVINLYQLFTLKKKGVIA